MPVKKKENETMEQTTTTADEPEPAPVEEPGEGGRMAKKAGKIILGVLVTLLGLFLVWLFWPDFLDVLKGVIGLIVILVGLIIIALGWTD